MNIINLNAFLRGKGYATSCTYKFAVYVSCTSFVKHKARQFKAPRNVMIKVQSQSFRHSTLPALCCVYDLKHLQYTTAKLLSQQKFTFPVVTVSIILPAKA